MVMPRYLACDTVSSCCPWRMYWVLVIVLFYCYRDDMALFKIEFHFPFPYEYYNSVIAHKLLIKNVHTPNHYDNVFA